MDVIDRAELSIDPVSLQVFREKIIINNMPSNPRLDASIVKPGKYTADETSR